MVAGMRGSTKASASTSSLVALVARVHREGERARQPSLGSCSAGLVRAPALRTLTALAPPTPDIEVLVVAALVGL